MSRNSRHDVIATARRLFAQKGFHGTSMRDLGKELGLLGSSLYSHVGSKDELLVDVVREASVQFQSLADEVAAMAAPAPERLARLVEGHLEILIKDPDQQVAIAGRRLNRIQGGRGPRLGITEDLGSPCRRGHHQCKETKNH